MRTMWTAATFVAVCCMLGSALAWSSLSMEYKPPVKSSVKKFYERRGQPSKPSSRQAYAGALHSPSTFESRMRNLVTPPRPRAVARRQPDYVQRIESLQDFKTIVADEPRKVVAVRFYASWCKVGEPRLMFRQQGIFSLTILQACQAVEPHFYRMAKENPDIVFVDVPVTSTNAALHQGLGVPSLPYAHVYHPSKGLVEERKLTRKEIGEFKDMLLSYAGDDA